MRINNKYLSLLSMAILEVMIFAVFTYGVVYDSKGFGYGPLVSLPSIGYIPLLALIGIGIGCVGIVSTIAYHRSKDSGEDEDSKTEVHRKKEVGEENIKSEKSEKRKNIENEIENLSEKEPDLDTRKVEKRIEGGKLDGAREALDKLKKKFSKYEDTKERLEELDEKKSSLSTQLADEKIDKDAFNEATESIESERAKLEEELARLRDEIIHEDYEKPF